MKLDIVEERLRLRVGQGSSCLGARRSEELRVSSGQASLGAGLAVVSQAECGEYT